MFTGFTKVFCIFSIVFVHGTILGQINLGLTGKLINTIARVCIPSFFIITVYLFYTCYTKKYNKKHTLNLIKTFITWALIYIFYSAIIIIMSNIIHARSIFYGISDYFNDFNIIDIYYATGIIKHHL